MAASVRPTPDNPERANDPQGLRPRTPGPPSGGGGDGAGCAVRVVGVAPPSIGRPEGMPHRRRGLATHARSTVEPRFDSDI